MENLNMSRTQRERDLARKPLPFAVGWGLPIAVLISVNFLRELLPAGSIILLMGSAFIWMGAGCVINAVRCGRLHCYVSGPVLLAGGALILLVGFNVADLGPIHVTHISNATILIVALSFIPEILAGSYGQRFRTSGKE